MYLPTLTHFGITTVFNLPLSALAPCINLEQLDIRFITVTPFEESDLDLPPEIGRLQIPKILQFSHDSSTPAVGKLLNAKWKDGRPLLDFTHLKTLFIEFSIFENTDISRNLFKSLEQLEKLSITGIQFLAAHD
jgi:hypothetical protein